MFQPIIVQAHNQNILSFSDYYLDATETRGSYSLSHNPANLIYSSFLQTELQIGGKSINDYRSSEPNEYMKYNLFFGQSTKISNKVAIGAHFEPNLVTDFAPNPQSGFNSGIGFAFQACQLNDRAVVSKC